VDQGGRFVLVDLLEVKVPTYLVDTQNKTAALEWRFGELCNFEYVQYAQLLVSYSYFDIIFESFCISSWFQHPLCYLAS
jgi:hypothetical protein